METWKKTQKPLSFWTVLDLPVSLGSPSLGQLVNLSLFLMTWAFVGSAGQAFWRMPHYWKLSDVFLMMRPGLWILRKKIKKAKCHFYHILSRLHTINMIYDCWCWPWPLDWDKCLRLFHCTATLFFPLFPYCPFCKKVIMYSHTSGLGNYDPPLRIE